MPDQHKKNGHPNSSNGNGLKKDQNLKITAVGDGLVGKTCMLITYAKSEFPDEYVPTVFDNYPCDIEVDKVNYPVVLWDTAGQEDYDRLRPLSYPNTACFLVCFAINNKSSFDNVLQKWYPELKNHCPKIPIILIGTKDDLRGTDQEIISPKMAHKLKRQISAWKYLECSALENRGLNEIFVESVKCAIKAGTRRRVGCCFLPLI